MYKLQNLNKNNKIHYERVVGVLVTHTMFPNLCSYKKEE
jgi:hypothetical protein